MPSASVGSSTGSSCIATRGSWRCGDSPTPKCSSRRPSRSARQTPRHRWAATSTCSGGSRRPTRFTARSHSRRAPTRVSATGPGGGIVGIHGTSLPGADWPGCVARLHSDAERGRRAPPAVRHRRDAVGHRSLAGHAGHTRREPAGAHDSESGGAARWRRAAVSAARPDREPDDARSRRSELHRRDTARVRGGGGPLAGTPGPHDRSGERPAEHVPDTHANLRRRSGPHHAAVPRRGCRNAVAAAA